MWKINRLLFRFRNESHGLQTEVTESKEMENGHRFVCVMIPEGRHPGEGRDPDLLSTKNEDKFKGTSPPFSLCPVTSTSSRVRQPERFTQASRLTWLSASMNTKMV